MTDDACRNENGDGFFARFKRDKAAMAGLVFIIFLFLASVYAPLITNSRPLLMFTHDGGLSSPALSEVLAPAVQEAFVERLFNFLMAAVPLYFILRLVLKRVSRKTRLVVTLIIMALLAVPFTVFPAKNDTRSFVQEEQKLAEDEFMVFAPVRFGPYETSSDVFAKTSKAHPFGTDHVGRDVMARMLFGGRVSLAVGVLATAITIFIGTSIGLLSGYLGGRFDLTVQRIVETVICFPTFLLLLILMSIMLDNGSRQSVLLVTAVLGFTSWPGLCRLVRGEVLKQRQMGYVLSCEGAGLPLHRILLRHLLPNVSAPIFVSAAFDVAGAILAENSLSFLGFGVQEPSASWGELLRQAFADPVEYYLLMLWPGLAIFLTVASFNFVADGIRKSIDRKA